MRLRISLALALSVALLAGCEPTPEAPDTTPTGNVTIDTTDTQVTDGYMQVGTFAFGAQFGYDALLDELVPVTVNGTAIAPTLDVYLGEPGWNADLSLDGMYCTVTISLDGAPSAQWAVTDPLYWRGFDATGAGDTDCDNLDPDEYGTDIVAQFAALDVGLAVGPRSADLDSWLLPQIPADEARLWFGGTLKVSAIIGQDVELAYGNAYEVDDLFDVILDNTGSPIRLDTTDLEAPGTGSAWYVVNSATYFTL